MSRPGPAPLSAEEKFRRGTLKPARERARLARESTTRAGTPLERPRAPSWLDPVAKAYFKRLSDELAGTLTRRDLHVLAGAAAALSLAQRCTVDLAKVGLLDDGRGKMQHAHPLIKACRDSRAEALAHLESLGCSPRSRRIAGEPVMSDAAIAARDAEEDRLFVHGTDSELEAVLATWEARGDGSREFQCGPPQLRVRPDATEPS